MNKKHITFAFEYKIDHSKTFLIFTTIYLFTFWKLLVLDNLHLCTYWWAVLSPGYSLGNQSSTSSHPLSLKLGPWCPHQSNWSSSRFLGTMIVFLLSWSMSGENMISFKIYVYKWQQFLRNKENNLFSARVFAVLAF